MALTEELGLELVAGDDEAGRPIRWVHISELEDPTQWLTGCELLLTTGIAARRRRRSSGASCSCSREKALAGLGIGTGFEHKRLPKAMVQAAAEHGLPLFEVPYEMPFIALTERAFTELVNEDYGVLERGLAAAGAARAAGDRRGAGSTRSCARSARRSRGSALLLDANGASLGGEGVEGPPLTARSRPRSATRTRKAAGLAVHPRAPGAAPRAVVVPLPDGDLAEARAWLAVVKARGRARRTSTA